ncbi:MAG: class I SAM-dependent methyltransferase, partial [Nitrospirota bacterium]|nr:class I SAM-dependent methyltransferase [Nitrospirota bacterium]
MKQWQCHNGDILDSIGSFDVIECGPCGFKHIVPIPTPKDLDQVYRDDYYAREKPLYLAEHREDLEWWNVVYDERYDMFESLVPPTTRRILDVGSGPGYFLKRGQDRGWTTVGIEPSHQAASHSLELGLNIIEGFLEESLIGTLGSFDVIHMHEVLEHIPHPADLIQLASRLLNPEGVLCVIVPNDYNPLQQLLRKHLEYSPWWVTPPHHINYFDHGSLTKLIESVGFQVLRKTS